METWTYTPRTFAEKATDPIAFWSYMVIGAMLIILWLSMNALLSKAKRLADKIDKMEEEPTVWTKEHGEEKLSDHYKRIGKK